jgi:hypothetical protein
MTPTERTDEIVRCPGQHGVPHLVETRTDHSIHIVRGAHGTPLPHGDELTGAP